MNSFIQFNSLDFYKLAKIATDQHKTEMVENSGRGVEQQKQKNKVNKKSSPVTTSKLPHERDTST